MSVNLLTPRKSSACYERANRFAPTSKGLSNNEDRSQIRVNKQAPQLRQGWRHYLQCKLRRRPKSILILLIIFLQWYLYNFLTAIWKNQQQPFTTNLMVLQEFHPMLRNRSTFTLKALNTTKLYYLTARFDNGSRTFLNREDVDYHSGFVNESQLFKKEHLFLYTDFPDWILNDTRWTRHLRFLRNNSDDSSRGAGYWFWKPVLLLHHLELMRDGDFIFYSDPDREDFLEWFEGLIETMLRRRADFAMEQLHFYERNWSKADTYAYFSCMHPNFQSFHFEEDDRLAKAARRPMHLHLESDFSLQYDASLILVRRCQKSMQIIRDWRDAAQRYDLISDEKSVLPNAYDFIENRHDQSLLSLLLKCKYKERLKRAYVHNISDGWSETTTNTFQLDRKAAAANYA